MNIFKCYCFGLLLLVINSRKRWLLLVLVMNYKYITR